MVVFCTISYFGLTLTSMHADTPGPRCSWLYSPAAQLAMVGAALSTAWVRIRVSITKYLEYSRPLLRSSAQSH